MGTFLGPSESLCNNALGFIKNLGKIIKPKENIAKASDPSESQRHP